MDIRRSDISTGVEGLDNVLGGGFPRGGFYIVSGAPGTGKTLMGFQYALRGAEEGEPSLVVTMEEGRENVEMSLPPVLVSRLKDTENIYLLDLAALRKITTPEENGEDLGLDAMGDIISRWSKERGLKRCVLDGLGVVSLFYPSEGMFREALFRLAARIRKSGVTALFTMESVQGTEAVQRGVEEYVADGIISLSYARGLRHLQVLKMRGKGFLGGWHDMEINSSGVHVYPRRYFGRDHKHQGDKSVSANRHSDMSKTKPVEPFGARELDVLLGGGIYPWEIIGLSGSPGTGKTALSFLYLGEALKRKKKTLYISMKHSLKELFTMAEHWGLDLRGYLKNGHLRVLTPMPLETLPYKHLMEIEKSLDGVTRVVVDAVNDYALVCRDHEKGPSFDEYIAQVVSLLREHSVSALLISESREVMGSHLIGEMSLMYHVDTGILLRYVELQSEFKKAVMVLKRRMGGHSHDVVEIKISPEQVSIGGKFEGVGGVMSGKATREELLEKFFG